MEIILDKKSNTEGLIKIKLTEGDYQPHVEEKVKDYARKANIKGFRPGKVPSGVIRKMFGKSILVDEINQLLSHKLSDYIKDNNLKILGDPLPNLDKANEIDWDSQKNFEFEYEIGMVEEFSYDLSEQVSVTGYTIEADKKVVDEAIGDLTQRFSEETNAEVSEAGDKLFGTLTEKAGGAEGFQDDDITLEIGQLEESIQSKFIGLKENDEVTFDISKLYTDVAKAAKLLDKPDGESDSVSGEYIFKVKTILHATPAALNQELFDKVFGKDAVKSEEEFTNKVKATIEENYKRETEHFLNHNIEDYFIKKTVVNLPENFLKQWLKKSGKEITDEVLEKEFDHYKRGLVWDLIKNRIAEDHQIKVDPDEVKAKAKELIAAQFGGGTAILEQLGDRMDGIVDNYLSGENGQNFTRVYQQLRDEKIMQLIREKIKITDQQVDLEEFKKIVDTHEH